MGGWGDGGMEKIGRIYVYDVIIDFGFELLNACFRGSVITGENAAALGPLGLFRTKTNFIGLGQDLIFKKIGNDNTKKQQAIK